MAPPAATASGMILSVSVAGILATSLLLLAYYLFLTRCGVASWGSGDRRDQPHRVVIVPAPVRRGLEEAAIRRIPTFRYRKEQKQVASECAVCLGEFQAGERLRLLPPCLHAFHIDCIDAWLHATANCPLCRAALSASDCHHHLDIATVDDAAASVVIDVASGGDDDDGAARKCGDECIAETSRRRCREPMRRSLSMDSCGDKHFYLALQKVLQQQRSAAEGVKEESSTAAAGGRLRRSFFSFSQRQGRSAISPI